MKKAELEELVKAMKNLASRLDEAVCCEHSSDEEEDDEVVHSGLEGTNPAHGNPFQRRSPQDVFKAKKRVLHVYGIKKKVCRTDIRGYSEPKEKSPISIVVNSSSGFIPLWTKGVSLRWRFKQDSMEYLENPSAAMTALTELFAQAVSAWGDAAPIRFEYREDAWDFEFAMQSSDDCDQGGCTLAQAFFPDGGRHELRIFPKMFEQSRKEQIDTFIHEIGHIFGLRHFFAKVSEQSWPSEIFGEHDKFSIMNYGANSELTPRDKADLKSLYDSAWNDTLTSINGTPIKFVKPFSSQM